MFRHKLSQLVVLSGIISGTISLQQISHAHEFDHNLLELLGADENVDLTAFAGTNEQFAGEYLARVLINDMLLSQNTPIYFYTKNNESHICFTKELISTFPLKKTLYRNISNNVAHTTDEGDCYDLENHDASIEVAFNPEIQELSIKMPHAYMERFDPSWVPPQKRDYGISGVFVDYSLLKMFNRSSYAGTTQTGNSFTSFGTVGANIGRLRFRSNYQYDTHTQGSDKLKWLETYGFTDIASLNSQLYFGELHTRSNVFDTTRFKGVSFFTEERMMPSYLQGYAPQITGTVMTNAVVTVKQFGNIIKVVQVPAGPFLIEDLPSYLNGTVDVEVEENNGNRYSYQVDISQIPFLTRKGGIRYNVNVGKLSPSYASNISTNLISADASYGLTSNISLIGGVLHTTNNEYRAINAGVGLNMGSFGALSIDMTRSKNKVNDQRELEGQSYRINYAKRFGTSTSLNLASYRISSQDFTTLNNYIDMKSGQLQNLRLEKHRFSLSVSQNVPLWDVGFSASISKSTYWNRQESSYYSLSAHTTIKSGLLENTSVSLGFSHNKNEYNRNNNQISLFLHIPLDGYRTRLSYSARYDQLSDIVSQQVSYSSQASFGGDYTLGASTYHRKDLSGAIEYGLDSSYYRNFGFGTLTTSANYSDKQQAITAGIDGSLTLTKHGLAAQPRVYNDASRLIVDAGASDVEILGTDSKTNIFGLAGVSNVPEYYRMNYMIDNDNLPENVDVQDSVIDLAASKGAIVYRSVNAISGEKVVSVISLPDGGHPPFGAVVYRENGKNEEVAMVANNGLTYLTGINQKSKFIVKWGGNQSCRLSINSSNIVDLKQLTCYME